MNIFVEGTYESLLEKFTEDKDVTNVLRELLDRHYKGMCTLKRTVVNGNNVRIIMVTRPPFTRQWTVAIQEIINTLDLSLSKIAAEENQFCTAHLKNKSAQSKSFMGWVKPDKF